MNSCRQNYQLELSTRVVKTKLEFYESLQRKENYQLKTHHENKKKKFSMIVFGKSKDTRIQFNPILFSRFSWFERSQLLKKIKSCHKWDKFCNNSIQFLKMIHAIRHFWHIYRRNSVNIEQNFNSNDQIQTKK